MKRFFKKQRNINHLILSIIGLCSFAWFTTYFAPETLLLFIIFYSLIGFMVFFLCLFIFANIRQAALVVCGVIVYLLLRYLNLRHPLYLILLIAVLYSLRVYYNKRD